MYFRSLSLFAAVACAAFSAAIPLGGADFDGISGAVSGLGANNLVPVPRSPVTGNGLAAGVSSALGGVSNLNAAALDLQPNAVPRGVDHHPSLPEIFDGASKKIRPLAEKLELVVKTEIKVEVLVEILDDIIDILGDVLINVQYIVDHPTGFALTLGETILSVKEVAVIISTLLYTLFGAIVIVVRAIDVATGQVILSLVASISVIVAHFLGLAFVLVPGLLAALVILLHPLIATFYYLKLTAVIEVLGLATA